VNWVRVKSRMLAAVAYNPDWHQLYLEFVAATSIATGTFQLSDMRNFWRLSLRGSILGTTFCSTFLMIGFREHFAARADLYFSEK
jgi:hypothetical protein